MKELHIRIPRRLYEKYHRACGGDINAFALHCMEERCDDESFYHTIVKSEEWKKWREVADERGWDVVESTETGRISSGHWKDFCAFIRRKNG